MPHRFFPFAMVQGQLIGSYVHMREKPREQHALFMLRKIASLVKPIMQQRGFKVGCLAEFWPDENNLLGMLITDLFSKISKSDYL